MVTYQTPILSVGWNWSKSSLWWWWVVVVCKPILVFSLGFDQAEQKCKSGVDLIVRGYYLENKLSCVYNLDCWTSWETYRERFRMINFWFKTNALYFQVLNDDLEKGNEEENPDVKRKKKSLGSITYKVDIELDLYCLNLVHIQKFGLKLHFLQGGNFGNC